MDTVRPELIKWTMLNDVVRVGSAPLTVLWMCKNVILGMKFSSQLILKSIFLYVQSNLNFKSMKTQVIHHKICIWIFRLRIRIVSGSRSCRKVLILPDPDPQHCPLPCAKSFHFVVSCSENGDA